MDPKAIMSLALGGVAGLAGGAMSGSSGGKTDTSPTPLPPEPTPQQQPGRKPGRPQTPLPSFIGSAATPNSANTGGKTLLGSV